MVKIPEKSERLGGLKGLVWRYAGKFACCVLGQGT